MEADLQTKVEKYEGKAAKCKEWAQEAAEIRVASARKTVLP